MSGKPDYPNAPRHARTKAMWNHGQRWETLCEGCDVWVPVSESGFAQPLWDDRQEYRLMADQKGGREQ